MFLVILVQNSCLAPLFCLVGKQFALQSGKEHGNLRFSPTRQVTLHIDGERLYLLYKEDTSKSSQGGLKSRTLISKSVKAFDNPPNPERCIVQIYEKYVSKRPPGATGVYLKPPSKAKVDCWYCNSPISKNTLCHQGAHRSSERYSAALSFAAHWVWGWCTISILGGESIFSSGEWTIRYNPII